MGPSKHRCGLTRRGFLAGAGATVAAGSVGSWYAHDLYQRWRARADARAQLFRPWPYVRKQFTGKAVEVVNPGSPMPGPYPGKVIEVHHPASVDDGRIIQPAVRSMLGRGMSELTGRGDSLESWRRLFQPGERVGLKVNPVGYSRVKGRATSISSFALIYEVVQALRSIGVKDVLLFERYSGEFREAGYDWLAERELNVPWFAASTGYFNLQTDLDGHGSVGGTAKAKRDPNVVGYHKEKFARFDFTTPAHDQKDPLSFQSHVSGVLTGSPAMGSGIDKFINLCVLKDHRSAGITMALKNMSHGMSNNVARTHMADGRNFADVFIPTVVSLQPIRDRAALHIMDGLIAVYEGGPGSWNNSWATWERKSLFFATDPVAMDHVGWDIIDAKRAEHGWPPVGMMGTRGQSHRSGTEAFHFRQPQHVEIAGTMGLGIFNPARIEYRRVVVKV